MVLGRCPVCAWPGCEHEATVADHIIPRRWGGKSSLSNGHGLCDADHNRKGAVENWVERNVPGGPEQWALALRGRLAWAKGVDDGL